MLNFAVGVNHEIYSKIFSIYSTFCLDDEYGLLIGQSTFKTNFVSLCIQNKKSHKMTFELLDTEESSDENNCPEMRVCVCMCACVCECVCVCE